MTIIIQQATDSVTPEHVVTISAKNRFTVPWMTKGLIRSGQTKLNYYKTVLMPNCLVADHEKYKLYRNKYNSLEGQTHIKYYSDKCIEYKNNTCKLWRIITSIAGTLNDKTSCIDHIK